MMAMKLSASVQPHVTSSSEWIAMVHSDLHFIKLVHKKTSSDGLPVLGGDVREQHLRGLPPDS